MASTHKHIRSSTANKRPTTAIADGQIALNTNSTSPGLFFKDSTGATIIKVGPVHVGTTAPNVSPAAGGSSGNSTGEIWLDTSLTPNGVKIWNGASWTNATPIGSTTVQGLLELATNAETQTGTDPDRAVTPAGLQSKVSDSTSTTSSTTIASSTAVKAAYDLANAALPASGGTVTGNLEIGTTGSLTFEGSTANGFETALTVVDPTADQTITLPNVTGTVITTGDTGTVTGTMIASGTVTSTNIVDGTIVDDDISASAEIAVSKLADGAARQLLQTDAAGTGVEWASNIDIPGTLDVTSAATFDSTIGASAGAAATPSITFTGDLNTGLWSPGADTIAASTAGSERVRIDSSGRVGIGTASPSKLLHVQSGSVSGTARGGNYTKTLFESSDAANSYWEFQAASTAFSDILFSKGSTGSYGIVGYDHSTDALRFHTASSERARIDSSGRLLVATSTARNNIYYTTVATTPSVQFETAVNSYSNGLSLINYSSSGYTPVLTLGSSSSSTQGVQTALASSFGMGAIQFVGSDGTNFRTGASIVATNDQAAPWAAGDCPTRLTFNTTADGASSPTERMRIKNNGETWIVPTLYGLVVSTAAAAGTTYTVFEGLHSGGSVGSGTLSFRIFTNGNVQNTNNSYGAISDIKLKENIVDATSQWDDIKALQVRKYNFKEGQTHTQIGLIAQEVELVSPGLVSESPDRDSEGNDLGTVTKSVNYSVLYMKAVKALQEAMERIETLEAKVAALEAA